MVVLRSLRPEVGRAQSGLANPVEQVGRKAAEPSRKPSEDADPGVPLVALDATDIAER